MGSFTSGVAQQIMNALFPATTSTLVPFTATTTNVNAFRIYNNTDSASQVGIRAVGSNVIHTCHLIIGFNAAGAVSTPIGDGCFTANPNRGSIALSGTPSCGSPSWPGAGYVNYTGKAMVATGAGNHTWLGWNLSEDTTNNKGRAVSNGQIAFPTLGAGSSTQNVWGFCITAQGTDAAVNTPGGVGATGFLIAAPTTPAPLIVAYGDLSTARAVSADDTPVFANQAITITLE